MSGCVGKKPKPYFPGSILWKLPIAWPLVPMKQCSKGLTLAKIRMWQPVLMLCHKFLLLCKLNLGVIKNGYMSLSEVPDDQLLEYHLSFITHSPKDLLDQQI